MPVNTPHTPLAPADESTGRFLSPDPVVQAPENTQNYNRYSYALNNPLKYTDPSGMSYAPHPDDERLYVNDLMAVYHGRNSGNMNLHAYNQWMYDMMDANSQWQYMGQQRFDNMYGVGAFSAMSSLHNFRNALNNSSYYHFTGAAAKSLFGMMKSAHKDGFNLYGVQAFGRLTIVSSLGDIGSTEFGQNGAIGFSNPTASAFMSAVEATNGEGNLSYTSVPDWVNKTNTGVGAFMIANTTKEQLISYAARTGDIGKTRAKYLKVVKGTGVAGSVFGMGVSGYNIYNDYSQGGIEAVNGWDVTDFGVGAVGLGVSGLATFGLVSNPIGWGVAIGTGIYFGGRLIYDIARNE